MDRTPAATHAGHDEMLIVRLYGGDVDESERARALDLMVDCRECANLFADLGAIAEASAAMPVPPRPRDFALTDKDAPRAPCLAAGDLRGRSAAFARWVVSCARPGRRAHDRRCVALRWAGHHGV